MSRSALALLLVAGGCVDQLPGLAEGTTSFTVEVLEPETLGSAEVPLPDTVHDVSLRVTALDEQGQLDSTFSGQIDVYTHFLGTLSPTPGSGAEHPVIDVTAGAGQAVMTLPLAYGPTYLWVEDGSREGATFATGTSPTLWYREPFLDDVSRPIDEARLDALYRSPLEKKQVRVGASKHGADGHLVVTAVYAQGYTVSDVNCAVPPCVADPYAHMYVYTFGRPRGAEGEVIAVGDLVSAVSGGVGEFNGLTELNFPRSEMAGASDLTRLPEPVVLQAEWLATATGATGMINLERNESGLVAAVGGTVCPLDDEYDTYAQWKVDIGGGCGTPINVITKGAVVGFDPADWVGLPIPRVVGTLRAVNIGSFNVWIMYPRDGSDLTLE